MLRITELLTPRVELRVGQERWPIIFTHALLLDLEKALNVSIVNGKLDITKLSAKALRTTVFVALSHSGAQYSAEEVGRKLGIGGIPQARASLIEAWIAAMPEKEPEDSRRLFGVMPRKQKPRTWMDVWANNHQFLHITDEEWLGMTPRMIQALDRQRLEAIRQEEFMLSRIAAAVTNTGYRSPEKPVVDGHFMMHPWPEEAQEVTGEYIMGNIFKGVRCIPVEANGKVN